MKKERPIRVAIFSLFFVLLVSYCFGGPLEMVKYDFKDRGFSIEIPKDWRLNTKTASSLAVFVLDKDKNSYDKYMVLVSVIIKQPSEPVNLDGYFKEELGIIKSLPAFQVIEIGDTDINGVKAKWVLYNYSSYNEKQLQYFIIINNRKYIIMCSTSAKSFNYYKDLMERIVHSIKFE